MTFQIGIFPDVCKTGRTVPLFKSGKANELNNYRPISILPAFAKICEKLLYDTINNFTFKYKLINDRQYGFQKQSGSISAATDLIAGLQQTLDSPNNMCAAIFIDLKKAFDTVPIDILLIKLEKLGIRGPAYNIIKSYLSNRNQFVSLNQISSDKNNISISVPQGSNLGPLLFLLFINDIFEVKFNGKLILFADDAELSYHNAQSTDNLFDLMQNDLNLLSNWLFNNNLLTSNIEKTKYLLFRAVNCNRVLNFENNIIHESESIKYLGLIIDNKLKWYLHVDIMKRKIAAMASVVKRIQESVHRSVLRSIYFRYVNSHISYMIAIYGNSLPLYKIREIQILQNIIICNTFFIDYYLHQKCTNTI